MVRLKNLNAAVQKIVADTNKRAVEDTKAIMAKEADIARQAFKSAHYDGINDVTVSDPVEKNGKVSVAFKGEALLYIEYGTGVWRDPGFVSEQTFDTIWYFTGSGPVKANHATYERGGYYKTISRNGKEHRLWNLSKDFLNGANDRTKESDEAATLWAKGTSFSGLGVTSKKKQRSIQIEWVPKETVPKKNSYISSGNSPHMIMHQMIENIERALE